MELTEARNMLANDDFNHLKKERWADLGCGSGTFTLALAGLLQPQSSIYAMDTNRQALKQIPAEYNQVNIEKIEGNFEEFNFPFNNLDGILMANSLHYVKDKASFIREAISSIKDDGCFLLVEYDTEKANQWVPYPLSFSSLVALFHKAGFSSTRKLQERPSLFRRANLYSVLIKR